MRSHPNHEGEGSFENYQKCPWTYCLKCVDTLRATARMLIDSQIFGNLYPLDVLHLARSTKALRAILMRRSAVSVWKAAFLNVPKLPPLPRDMTEPEYANLAFSRHCHVRFCPPFLCH
jgi:hypothetical protein